MTASARIQRPAVIVAGKDQIVADGFDDEAFTDLFIALSGGDLYFEFIGVTASAHQDFGTGNLFIIGGDDKVCAGNTVEKVLQLFGGKFIFVGRIFGDHNGHLRLAVFGHLQCHCRHAHQH